MIALRMDADHARGMGHLFRMRILADALMSMGIEVVLVLRENPVAQTLVTQWGLTAVIIPTKMLETDIPAMACTVHPQLAIWIFDVLATQEDWVLTVKAHGLRVVVFDDTGPGSSHADLRINPIIGCWQRRPNPLPNATLDGPRYAVLPARLADLKQARQVLTTTHALRHVAITLGGSDTHGATLKLVACAAEWAKRHANFRCLVFTGPHFQHEAELTALLAPHGAHMHWHRNVPDLLAALSTSDAVICSGGQTLFEVAALGLPILAVANEPHERQTLDYFAARHALWNAGDALEPTPAVMQCFFQAFTLQDQKLQSLGSAASQLVDCLGAQRCAAACIKLLPREYRHVQACYGQRIPKEL